MVSTRPRVMLADDDLGIVRAVGRFLEACHQITQMNPGMKVIVFTAMSDPDVAQRSFEAGASAFVGKLAAADELLSAITRLCVDRR